MEIKSEMRRRWNEELREGADHNRGKFLLSKSGSSDKPYTRLGNSSFPRTSFLKTRGIRARMWPRNGSPCKGFEVQCNETGKPNSCLNGV